MLAGGPDRATTRQMALNLLDKFPLPDEGELRLLQVLETPAEVWHADVTYNRNEAAHPTSSCSDCGHASDCATHNDPAMPSGACTCKASEGM
jgi:hypothetical protein